MIGGDGPGGVNASRGGVSALLSISALEMFATHRIVEAFGDGSAPGAAPAETMPLWVILSMLDYNGDETIGRSG